MVVSFLNPDVFVVYCPVYPVVDRLFLYIAIGIVEALYKTKQLVCQLYEYGYWRGSGGFCGTVWSQMGQLMPEKRAIFLDAISKSGIQCEGLLGRLCFW
jgi:hypothetical protein